MKIRSPAKQAGGLTAVKSTAKFLTRETGLARGSRALLKMNQADGFDCPGCAWPEPARRAAIEYCENGAKAFAEEATTKRATPDLFASKTVEQLRELSDFELGQLGRITHPMALGEDRKYHPVSWAEVFEQIGKVLRELPDPNRATFYTSGRTSNEAAFLFQLLGRKLGTNNFPDCSNMCHESSGVGMSEVIGVGKGTVSLEDFDHADAVFVVGQNPGTNHPRMLSTLREVAARGAPIVSINPLKEPGLVRFSHPQKVGDVIGSGQSIASEFVQLRVGGDVPLFQGIAKAVLELEEKHGGVLDRAFIAEHTEGFDAYREHLMGLSWGELRAASGISERQMRRVARIYAEAERVIICWAMGITQHKNAVANVQEIINLLLLRGNLGKEGAGACPVRGHSNVQGDRTMGITPRPKAAFLDALGRVFDFEPPREPGYDTMESVDAMLAGEVDVFFAMGGNFYSATPDTEVIGQALSACQLTAHVSIKVNRSHLYPGQRSFILPCLGRTELDRQAEGVQFVTVEDSMSMVHRSQGHLTPASEHLLSEPAIVAGLANTALGEDWSAWIGNYDRIRDLIEQTLPGFESYNERVRSERGFRLPNGARERDFSAVGGRAKFTVHPVPDLRLPPGRLRMMTMRSHDQYNTTVYGLDDRYRGVFGVRRVVFLNAKDMEEMGVKQEEPVDLVSEFEGEERRAEGFIAIRYDLPQGCAATYFPEANCLVPAGSRADKSNTPTSKSVVIRIEKRG